MKQYTTNEQTAKLIELGFEKPKSTREMVLKGGIDGVICFAPEKAYSIGELIEMLPKHIMYRECYECELVIKKESAEYRRLVNKEWSDGAECTFAQNFQHYNSELIDNLFEMIVNLKEAEIL